MLSAILKSLSMMYSDLNTAGKVLVWAVPCFLLLWMLF